MADLVSRNGNRVHVTPGLVYAQLNAQMSDEGLHLPFYPSSYYFCSVGGNLGTKASGLRSVKYGSIDDYIRSLRFVSAVHGLVDTSGDVPEGLADDMINLKNELESDRAAMAILDSRKELKTSSGYNLRSLINYDEPRDIITHLMAGSIGTLGLFAQIELELVPKPTEKITCLCFFRDVRDAASFVPALVGLGPSAIEMIDSNDTAIVKEFCPTGIPEGQATVLMIEFDENIARSEEDLEKLLRKSGVDHFIEKDEVKQGKIWDLRESTLLRIKREHETRDKRYLSFVDDLSVPVKHLADFLSDIQAIFRERNVPVFMFGHVGEGNIHVRPYIDRKNWREDTRILADKSFKTAFKYRGSVSGEHGSGRNRAPYLREEWGDSIFTYFKKVKNIFDPDDILNPGAMFSESNDITSMLEF
jgi:FAD/FMN-containing dehydrogenase